MCHHAIRDIQEADGPYDHILDGVGGAVLTRCLEVVAPHGMVVSYASTLLDPATLGPRWFGAHLGATLRSFLVFDELRHTQSAASDLSALCALVAAGDAHDPHRRRRRTGAGRASSRAIFSSGASRGKVVLTIGPR